jgi:hypothetical protein
MRQSLARTKAARAAAGGSYAFMVRQCLSCIWLALVNCLCYGLQCKCISKLMVIGMQPVRDAPYEFLALQGPLPAPHDDVGSDEEGAYAYLYVRAHTDRPSVSLTGATTKQKPWSCSIANGTSLDLAQLAKWPSALRSCPLRWHSCDLPVRIKLSPSPPPDTHVCKFGRWMIYKGGGADCAAVGRTKPNQYPTLPEPKRDTFSIFSPFASLRTMLGGSLSCQRCSLVNWRSVQQWHGNGSETNNLTVMTLCDLQVAIYSQSCHPRCVVSSASFSWASQYLWWYRAL